MFKNLQKLIFLFLFVHAGQFACAEMKAYRASSCFSEDPGANINKEDGSAWCCGSGASARVTQSGIWICCASRNFSTCDASEIVHDLNHEERKAATHNVDYDEWGYRKDIQEQPTKKASTPYYFGGQSDTELSRPTLAAPSLFDD